MNLGFRGRETGSYAKSYAGRHRISEPAIEPPSWVLGEEVLAAGGKGILFQSRLRQGGTNLVIYPDALVATDSLTVCDPGQALPKIQDPWA